MTPLVSKCHPSTKWLARVGHVIFKTKVLYFKISNTPIKDTNVKKKFKRMLSFHFVDKRELSAMKLSFEEFNVVSFFTGDLPCKRPFDHREKWSDIYTFQ